MKCTPLFYEELCSEICFLTSSIDKDNRHNLNKIFFYIKRFSFVCLKCKKKTQNVTTVIITTRIALNLAICHGFTALAKYYSNLRSPVPRGSLLTLSAPNTSYDILLNSPKLSLYFPCKRVGRNCFSS